MNRRTMLNSALSLLGSTALASPTLAAVLPVPLTFEETHATEIAAAAERIGDDDQAALSVMLGY